MKISDPVTHCLQEYGYSSDLIEEVVVGDKYLACLLKNGQLGVCATLGHDFPENYSYLSLPDSKKLCDRILLNAYFNALLNYDRKYTSHKDIYDFIHFEKYKRIVMVGYFASLITKFYKAGIHLDIFDLNKQHPDVIPMNSQIDFISRADAMILTSTSLFNGSFASLVKVSRKNSDIFMLGPSTILNPFMYQYPNISKIFGTIFPQNQKLVMKMIKEGHGTPSFGKLGHKVYL
ncbi:MAG: DUF364 domain-containing protein [Bacteroidota bacterium]|nr:DUF364 domain-containing protein [Bacteroidota bacterium]